MRARIDFFIILIGCILLSIICGDVFAAPPYITDDPIPVDFHHTQLFLFETSQNIKSVNELNAPSIEFNYGILPNLEFALFLSFLTVRPNPLDDDQEVINASGISDTAIDLKYMFLKESKCYPAMAIVPTYILSTGDPERGLGNGHGWYYLPIWVQKTWGKWTSYGGGGYAYNPVKNTSNFWFGGVVVQREITDKLIIGGEVYSQGTVSTTEKGYTLINLGLTYTLRKNVDLLFSIGNNITGARIFVTYLGLGFAW